MSAWEGEEHRKDHIVLSFSEIVFLCFLCDLYPPISKTILERIREDLGTFQEPAAN